MILLDTNILLRSKQASSEHFQFVTERLLEFVSQDENLVINAQVISEFYVVATRPAENNGLGLSSEIANREIDNLLNTYLFIDDNKLTFYHWRKLIMQFDVSGKAAHDTKMVAFMLANQIPKLFTLNNKDFSRYQDLIQLV
jgi:predicted nucleic acid-binding protein